MNPFIITHTYFFFHLFRVVHYTLNVLLLCHFQVLLVYYRLDTVVLFLVVYLLFRRKRNIHHWCCPEFTISSPYWYWSRVQYLHFQLWLFTSVFNCFQEIRWKFYLTYFLFSYYISHIDKWKPVFVYAVLNSL
jgi:hypothetical protein